MRVCCFLFFAILMTVDAGISADLGNKQVLGWRERVRLLPEDLVVEAKLDTGADTSSLNVPHLTRMQKDGNLWVRFSVTNSDGKQTTFEREVVRVAKIKRHFGERQERPVVIMRLCVGRYCADTEVNLVDRSRFTCQLLIGRRFMAHALVVDPALEHLAEPGNDGKEMP
jgi:hypothetical protein